MDSPTFVATVRLDDESLHRLNLLRRRYFPPHRDFIAGPRVGQELPEAPLALRPGAAKPADKSQRADESLVEHQTLGQL